jgi:Na+/proline symporter
MLELVAAIYGVALFGPLIVGLFWRGVTQAGAVAAMVSSGAVGVGWRGLGLEAATGIHMLNLCLPVSLFALVLISLHSRSR